ncbi:hypothetical protein V8B55DRAFT_1390517 [Mucor lusitanicus]|uniref:NIPSNAP domain-containing protein n=2 Tax=Mucor circinelloides f. lusitanicus TaxID=29924 RepID=A0A168IMM6_MUCCL|nr:hypothetical protein FB192DRAFT_1382900 [Mucor lusitanicus]OAD00124.1 hypothetical protein MUCCIDRAFT_156975 [Mucor lusitanicus CBS 277.49]
MLNISQRFLRSNAIKAIGTRSIGVRALSTSRSSLFPKNEDAGEPVDPTNKQSAGFIKSVLYGKELSGAGNVLAPELTTTHSKKLARGKYVHEMQTHRVKPDKVEEYIQLMSTHYPRIANDPQNEVHLCGSWEMIVGDLDTFVHIWEYKGYPGHKQTMERLAKDPVYAQFVKDLRPLLISRENNMMLEFSFWKTSPPQTTNGIYELRKYNLKPGNLLEWEYYWRKGLECRSQFCEPVGAWFSQLGNLHTVQHMWTYPDLQTRKTTREEAWKVEGWSDTVYKTVRLVDSMHSFILKPLDYSPLR